MRHTRSQLPGRSLRRGPATLFSKSFISDTLCGNIFWQTYMLTRALARMPSHTNKFASERAQTHHNKHTHTHTDTRTHTHTLTVTRRHFGDMLSVCHGTGVRVCIVVHVCMCARVYLNAGVFGARACEYAFKCAGADALACLCMCVCMNLCVRVCVWGAVGMCAWMCPCV